MDEMTGEFGGFVLAILAMLALMALVLAVAAFWLAWRRVRRGGLRRALVVTNALAFGNLGNAAMVAAGDGRSPLDLWLGLLVFVSGPLLAGYALGSTLALLTRPKA